MIQIEQIDLMNMLRNAFLLGYNEGTLYKRELSLNHDFDTKERDQNLCGLIGSFLTEGPCGVSYNEEPCSCGYPDNG